MNTTDAPSPLYQLVEEESGRIIISAHEIKGFFVESDRLESDEISISGYTQEPLPIGENLSDIELRVVDSAGKTIGSYYIGQVGLRARLEGKADDWQDGFVISFEGYTCPYFAAGDIWRRWASGGPLAMGEWATYPAEQHESWLHVVQNAWSEAGRHAKKYGTSTTCVIDGRQILSESSFYCALGEALNGPGGYFGWTLDGLEDCLSQSIDCPFVLVWEYFSDSQERMGEPLTSAMLGIFKKFGVAVRLTDRTVG